MLNQTSRAGPQPRNKAISWGAVLHLMTPSDCACRSKSNTACAVNHLWRTASASSNPESRLEVLNGFVYLFILLNLVYLCFDLILVYSTRQ